MKAEQKKIILDALDEGDWLNASIGLLNRGVDIGECRKLLEQKREDIDNALSGKPSERNSMPEMEQLFRKLLEIAQNLPDEEA